MIVLEIETSIDYGIEVKISAESFDIHSCTI